MKVRTGFVSNSSSSSFLLLVKDARANIMDWTPDIICYMEKNPDDDVLVIGKSLSDGYDIFVPNKKMREFLIKNKNLLFSSLSGIVNYRKLEGQRVGSILENVADFSYTGALDSLGDDDMLMVLNKDSNSSRTVEDLERRYVNEN